MEFTTVIQIPDKLGNIFSSQLLFTPLKRWIELAVSPLGGHIGDPGGLPLLTISRPVVFDVDFISFIIRLSETHHKIEVYSSGKPAGITFVSDDKSEPYHLEFSPSPSTETGTFCPIGDMYELSKAEDTMHHLVNRRLMLSGVRFISPSSTIVSPDCKIAPGAVILPNCIIRNASKIESGCTIGPNSIVSACSVGSGTEVNASQINDSIIGKNVHIGPFAYIRPGCEIGDNIKVGDFVELKKAKIGDGTKISHLTYVGDSEVGRNVNFGCGTVTVNYDGAKKHLTKIGDGSFIGCNTNLIAPVTIGKNVYTAAGSTITDDVPDDALAIARTRQTNRENWVPGYRLKIGKK